MSLLSYLNTIIKNVPLFIMNDLRRIKDAEQWVIKFGLPAETSPGSSPV